MTDTAVQKRPDAMPYLHRAITELSGLWNDKKVNRSGLRATFRRWRPTAGGLPTMDMRSAIWSWLGSPDERSEKPDETSVGERKDWRESDVQRTIDRSAVLVALRAVAGEHGGEPMTFGAALYHVGLGDLRFTRLLTTSRAGSLEAIRRAMQRIDREGHALRWDFTLTRRLADFLFGTKEAAQRSINGWAQEYFSARGKSMSAEESTTEPTQSSTPKE